MKRALIIFCLGILLLGCDENCEDTACFTPPNTFNFEVLDSDTRENLFSNETFSANQIKVTNSVGNNSLDFSFNTENNVDILVINSIGWVTEQVKANVSVNDLTLFDLSVDAERKNENCCTFTEYNEISIENAEFELDTESGIYRILVDL